MLKKLQVSLILLSALSYSAASSVSIGTVNARGDMRVDSYNIRGNATLFNGSVVETGQVDADLHLDKGTEIKLNPESRATMYSDHIVLQQGLTELDSSGAFKVTARGIQVSGASPNSRGIISVVGDAVEVSALSGSFGVTNAQGMMVAKVHPGQPLHFAMMAGGATNAFSAHGMVSFLKGNYYLTTTADATYQLTGSNLAKFVGQSVAATGTVVSPTLLSVSSMSVAGDGAAGGHVGTAGTSSMTTSSIGDSGSIIAGLLVVLGTAGLAALMSETLSRLSQPPASPR